MWTFFALGFGAGISNTAHCLGMCGGFPLHLAKSSHKDQGSLRQILFITGKTFTYTFLGAIAGAVGVVLLKDTSAARFAPLLGLFAGLLTIVFGLLMMGFRLPSINILQSVSDTGFIRSIFGSLLISPTPAAAFVLGLGVGFLPCPLPMIMLAASAASHNILHGMAAMAGVGLGTAPGLLAIGLFGVSLDRKFAQKGVRIAGVAVLIVGMLTAGRAINRLIHSKAAPAHSINQTLPSCCGGERH